MDLHYDLNRCALVDSMSPFTDCPLLAHPSDELVLKGKEVIPGVSTAPSPITCDVCGCEPLFRRHATTIIEASD